MLRSRFIQQSRMQPGVAGVGDTEPAQTSSDSGDGSSDDGSDYSSDDGSDYSDDSGDYGDEYYE